MQRDKGVYAVLLGSGVSRGTGIPTGWEITLQFIRDLAASQGEDPGKEPSAWYQAKYGREAGYSELLAQLGFLPAERRKTLVPFFEPTPDDLEAKQKTPTEAHRAIARLVAHGYISVILTINFDRLMEQALADEGVNPTIISLPEDIVGMEPLVHARCTLIKLHGDYLDARIKNTVDELAAYEPGMDALLDRVLDEYGLIVSGWSATWDPALASAFRRSPAGRYSTFWTLKEDPTEEAARLIRHKRAQLVRVESADTFFTAVEQKVLSIEENRQPHPLSTSEATASLKRFLVEERYRIRLYDLVQDEARQQVQLLKAEDFNGGELVNPRMQQYELSLQTLLQLLAVGCFHGEEKHHIIWESSIRQMSELYKAVSGLEALVELQLYPACLLFFACGLGAIAGRNYGAVRFLLREARIDFSPRKQNDQRLSSLLYPSAVLKIEAGGVDTPGSNRVFKALREPLRTLLPNDSRYDECFDRWEYLLCLTYFDLHSNQGMVAPVGRFATKTSSYIRGDRHVVHLLARESRYHGIDWLPFREGLFAAPPYFEVLSKAYVDQYVPWMSL